jgi:hypothetical protein
MRSKSSTGLLGFIAVVVVHFLNGTDAIDRHTSRYRAHRCPRPRRTSHFIRAWWRSRSRCRRASPRTHRSPTATPAARGRHERRRPDRHRTGGAPRVRSRSAECSLNGTEPRNPFRGASSGAGKLRARRNRASNMALAGSVIGSRSPGSPLSHGTMAHRHG